MAVVWWLGSCTAALDCLPKTCSICLCGELRVSVSQSLWIVIQASGSTPALLPARRMPAWIHSSPTDGSLHASTCMSWAPVMDTDVSVSSGYADRSSILKQFGAALRAWEGRNKGWALTADSSFNERLIGGSGRPGGKWFHCQGRSEQ